MSHQSSVAKKGTLRPRIKVWLELDGDYVFGFGLLEILKAIQGAGSMKAAAGRLGKSYRYVWGRVKTAETALGASLIAARVGGKVSHRSELTPLALRLMQDYDALRKRMFEVAEHEFAHRFAMLPSDKTR